MDTIKKAEKVALLFFFLLVLIIVADVLQENIFKKFETNQVRPSTVFPGSWSPICSLQKSRILVQTAKENELKFHARIACAEAGGKGSKNAFNHTAIAPKATATTKVDDRLKTPW